MATYSEIGDSIIGDTIICGARQVRKKPPIHKSGRHKIQNVVLKDNANATILKRSRFLSD